MVTMPRSLGDVSPPNVPNNTSTDTLPYFSPIAVRSHSPLEIPNVVNSYTIEPIIIPIVNEIQIHYKAFHIGLAILTLSLPIAVLIMNGIYGDDMQCYQNNTIPVFDHVNLVETIGFKTWFNVFGAFKIINIVIYFGAILLFVRKYSNGCLILLFCHITFSMFQFAWIIVGCFLFWRDCLTNLQPQQMNDLMWASILIGIFSELLVIIVMVYSGYRIYIFTKSFL